LYIEPGGYLQWAEHDVSSFRIDKAHPEIKVSALSQLFKLAQAQDARLRPNWVPSLPRLFADHGLENVQSDVRDAPSYLELAMHECNLPIFELIARKTHNEALAQSFKNLIPEAAKETREGSCWAFTKWTVVGRKPQGN
jgi:hypothetical protein